MPAPDHFFALSMDTDCALDIYSRYRPHESGEPGPWQRTAVRPHGKKICTETGPVENFDNTEIWNGLFVPVSAAAVARVRDLIDMSVLYGNDPLEVSKTGNTITKGFFPGYFTMNMTVEPEFEKRGKISSLFGGPETRYFQDSVEMRNYRDELPELPAGLKKFWQSATSLVRVPGDVEAHLNRHRDSRYDGTSLARYNCWTFVQGVTEYYARVDLSDIDPDLSRYHRAYQAMSWLGAQMAPDMKWAEESNVTKIATHPTRLLTGSVDKRNSNAGDHLELRVMQNDTSFQPALLSHYLPSFSALDGVFTDVESGASVSPLRDLYGDGLKPFGNESADTPLKKLESRPDLDGPFSFKSDPSRGGPR